jgi:CDP-glycerol glycerophosphotransferase (TagB/SpsB family)
MLQITATILMTPLRLLGHLFPKQNNLWVCGAWLGERYADNPKYLYAYIERHHPDQKVVWLTKNKEVYERIKKGGGNVEYFYSPRGIWYGLRAKYLVFCVAYQDLSYSCYLFAAKSIVINLWHGTPLKQLVVKRTKAQEAARNFLLALLGRECDYIASASPLVTEKLEHYFHIPHKNYLPTGYPRNDSLLAPADIAPGLSARMAGKKAVLFMPTFREYTVKGQRVNLFADFGFDPKKLERTLGNHNAVLLIKLHFRDRELLAQIGLAESERIIIVNDADIDGDVYSLLARTDVLITDYSSVYFDYLILDRPIIFSSFDLKAYVESDRGFYFDYNTMTPGTKTKNWSQLIQRLDEELGGKDAYAFMRKNVSSLVNLYKDAENSKRAYRAIVSSN